MGFLSRPRTSVTPFALPTQQRCRRRYSGFPSALQALLVFWSLLAAAAASALALYYLSIVTERSEAIRPALPVDLFDPSTRGPSGSSGFTIVIPTIPQRQRTLQIIVHHYSRCRAVQEIVIVKGCDYGDGMASFNPEEAFGALPVPVRVRTEAQDSLNNRFKPDPLVRTDAILSLDDDNLMWCSDLELGYQEWRQHPESLVGYFPRLILVDASALHDHGTAAQYLGERAAYRQGSYNAVITVGMFHDRSLMEAYWSDAYAAGRALVLKLHNCEDILMNYVAANEIARRRVTEHGMLAEIGAAQPAVRFVSPSRRLDIAKLSGVGISRNNGAHIRTREQCAHYFAEKYGGLFGRQLPTVPFNLSAQPGGGTALCRIPGLGCVYI